MKYSLELNAYRISRILAVYVHLIKLESVKILTKQENKSTGSHVKKIINF